MSNQPQPNIVLISLDTVRADHLSPYGYKRQTTPFLQALCQEATLFEWAFTTSNWTLPAHVSMVTGTYVSRHGVGAHATGLMKLANPWLITLAEYLQCLDYQTVGITNSGYLSRHSYFDRGFRDFWFVEEFFQDGHPLLDINLFGRYPGRFLNGLIYRYFHGRVDKGAARSIRILERWLRHRRRVDQPSFIFLHLFDAHAPYWPPKPWRNIFMSVTREHQKIAQNYKAPWAHMLNPAATSPETLSLFTNLYDSELAYVDSSLQKIVALLDQFLGGENTLLIVTADHGEALGDDGCLGHSGDTLGNSVARIPLLLRYPSIFAGGSRVSHPVSLVDLFPTIVAILGVSDDRLATQLDGIDLRSVSSEHQGRMVVSESLTPPSCHLVKLAPDRDLHEFDFILRSIVWRHLKLVAKSSGDLHLYNLDNDPFERHNLAGETSEQTRNLASKLEEWTKAIKPMLPPKPELDSGYDRLIRERLQGWGYLDI